MMDPSASPPDPTPPEAEVLTTSPLAARVPPAAEVLLTSPNQLYSERVCKLVCRLDRRNVRRLVRGLGSGFLDTAGSRGKGH